MRKNKLPLELDKKYKRKYAKNKTQNHELSLTEAQNIITNDTDVIDILNSNIVPELSDYKVSPMVRVEQSISHLKNLVNLLRDNNLTQSKKDTMNINGYDPTLNFRFLQRQTTKNICLPPIRTRLKWQNGEYPFFKIETRYYNKKTQKSTDIKKNILNIRAVSVQDTTDGSYLNMEYPSDVWPIKGQLYVSNLRLLFKCSNKEDFYIPFENILSYHFYNNSMTVEHYQDKKKSTDVFYVDENQARLLETVIHITL